MEDHEIQAKLFKALMHPVRLAILDILREDEACVCHMEAILKLRQAYISQHLMILRDAGLVEDRRDGWNIYYRVSEPGIFELIDLAGQITGSNSPGQKLLSKGQMICDCPKCRNKVNALIPQG